MDAQELKFVKSIYKGMIEKHFSTCLEYEVTIKPTTLENLLAEYNSFTLEQVATMLCNLEDTECMQEILDDNFEDSFDPWNESIFNDSYWDMSESLNLHGEFERNEEDED